jgi:CDGSH-type Zn-finger protein
MESDKRDKSVEFRVIPNGPLHAVGKFSIINTDGKKEEIEEEAWLCRCGASKNKPYCDGSHKTSGTRF